VGFFLFWFSSKTVTIASLDTDIWGDRMLKHFARAALCGASFMTFGQPVLAGNGIPVKLDQATWYVAPPEVQITNENPRLRDFRGEPQETRYEFNVPPMRQSAPRTVQINVPVGQLSGGGGQKLVIDPNHPPASMFESNVPAHSVAPANLPSGATTNLLMGRMPAQPSPAVLQAAPRMVSNKPRTAVQPVTEQYDPIVPTASSSSDYIAKTGLHGQVVPLGKGKLLQH
jgi:hypothetical protein